MRVVVIGAAGHIGTYLIPMLVNNGYDTVAITRKMSVPYEDAPAWHTSKRLLEYQPKYTCLETIDLAVKSYIDRGLLLTSDR